MLTITIYNLCSTCLVHASTLTVDIVDTISLDLVPTSPEGNFAFSDTSSNTISVTTDNSTGYSLGLSANTAGSNALTGSAGTIPSITSYVTATNYADDSYAASNNLNNTWGYSPSKYYNAYSETAMDNTGDNRIFFPAPTTVSTNNSMVNTLDVTSSANSEANLYNVAIGARIDYNTAPGSYSNTFVFTVVANPMRYNVNYYGNGGSGTTTGQSFVEGASIEISGNDFSRPNYYFKGWGTAPDTTTVVYRAGQTVVPEEDLDLYAVWGNNNNDTLYNIVASLNYGRVLTNTNTNGDSGSGLSSSAGIKAAITKENSGVFIYNPTIFGASSDAADTHTIYLYRGILDDDINNSNGIYGSSGNSANYPNYVKLGDTCWRIVRTTGSGGVKLIYNGLYSGGTTTNSCANAQADAGLGDQAFGLKGNSSQSIFWANNINRIGYTFNNDSSIQDNSTSMSTDIIFGSNANYSSINTVDSNIKDYLENTWFNSIANFKDMLEPSAGYCNDRTFYQTASSTATELTSAKPYSQDIRYFGSHFRNLISNGSGTPSLSCPENRNIVDLYTTGDAMDGNKQLKEPVALLTSDEVSFAGINNAYNSSTFLRTGKGFVLLSPDEVLSSGAQISYVEAGGYLNSQTVKMSYSVRPVISLKPGTKVASGSGTATNPWVVEQ